LIRIVFCDLDGTVVRSGNRVLAEDIETLREAVSCGVRLVFVTGRPARCLSDLPTEVTELSDQIITSNGAAEVVAGRTRIVAPLGGQLVRDFSAALRKVDPKVNFATEFETAFGFEPGYAWWPATDTGADAFRAEISDLAGGTLPITKLLCRSANLNAGDLVRSAEALGADTTITYSCRPEEGGPVEVMAPLASKGHAVRRVLKEAGIAPAAAVAFGDRSNDISMLDSVGDGVVVGAPAEPRLAVFESVPSVGKWLATHHERWRR
jgi:HAD superfamily hydrolase (TIGR01484 family)